MLYVIAYFSSALVSLWNIHDVNVYRSYKLLPFTTDVNSLLADELASGRMRLMC